MKKLLILFALLASIANVGCAVHKIEIQQGNVIEDKTRQQLDVGMTRNQVQFLMGTPLIADPFHRDRWDYVFFRRTGDQPGEERRLTLLFDGDKLAKIVEEITVPPKKGILEKLPLR